MEDGIFRILAIGDVVGKNGLDFLQAHLWKIRARCGADFVVANGENAAPGNGITKDAAETMFLSGADVVTSGNHVFRRADAYAYLDGCPKVLRPANYPKECPGFGSGIFLVGGLRILVMNLMGTVFMESLESPFDAAERILSREKGGYDLAVADLHAEATSEKLAFAHCFDGKINLIFGTHTHVQTNDADVLPGGTGYVTDVGMTGPYDSVLGVKKEIVIRKLRTKLPVRFEEAAGETLFCGAVFDYDLKSGRTAAVHLLNERY